MIIAGATQLDRLDFDKGGGLVPVVTQHALTGEVLMLAYANRAALERTLAEDAMWYFSRSRNELWRKGETSGNVQRLVSLHGDCDGDTVVARVLPTGPSCHTGDWSCFDAAPTLAALDAVIAQRASARAEPTAAVAAPGAINGAIDGTTDSPPADGSYTRRLLDDANLRLKKLGEESVELALACERGETERVAEEAADLLYHALVACRAVGVSAADVLASLETRRGVSASAVAPERGGRESEG